MSISIVRPNGDTIESTLIANGAPTHRAVTNTENGGRNGLIPLHIPGKNLINHQTCEKDVSPN